MLDLSRGRHAAAINDNANGEAQSTFSSTLASRSDSLDRTRNIHTARHCRSAKGNRNINTNISIAKRDFANEKKYARSGQLKKSYGKGNFRYFHWMKVQVGVMGNFTKRENEYREMRHGGAMEPEETEENEGK